MTKVPDPCSGAPVLYKDTHVFRRSLLTLAYEALDKMVGTSSVPSKEELDKTAGDDYLFRHTVLDLSCVGAQWVINGGGLGVEVDPKFTAWLAATPPVMAEVDPVFSAWLTTAHPVLTETDPVFNNWLAGPPNISAFNNNVGYLTVATLPPETDPVFTAWLATHPPYGLTQQIPYMNVAGTAFLYSANLTFTGVTLVVQNVQVNGSLHTEAGIYAQVTTVTNTYSILDTDDTIICNRATPFTVTLPDTLTIGEKFTIKNIGSGAVTVNTFGGAGLIDGAATQVLSRWDSIQVQCYSANNWGIL